MRVLTSTEKVRVQVIPGSQLLIMARMLVSPPIVEVNHYPRLINIRG